MNGKQRLFGLMLCVIFAADGRSVYAADNTRAAYPDPNRWSKEAETFQRWDRQNSFPENAVLFVGSSSIVQWPTAEAFVDFPIINRGFGGSVMADSVYYVEPFVLKYRPQVVVVYAGDNDCAAGIAPELIARDFTLLADTIHAALPETEIICLSVKLSESRKNLWPQMRQVNALYRQYAQEKDYVTYADVDAVLQKDDGMPDSAYYLADRLHLSEKGYAAWNEWMLPIIKERYVLAGKK
jgi:lysophospholipase L1-like esterase